MGPPKLTSALAHWHPSCSALPCVPSHPVLTWRSRASKGQCLLPALSFAPSCKGLGFPIWQGPACSCDSEKCWLMVSPTSWVQADREVGNQEGLARMHTVHLALQKKITPTAPRDGVMKKTPSTNMQMGLCWGCCALAALSVGCSEGLASSTATLRTTQLEMQRGRAGISPLPRHHCVYLHGHMGCLAILKACVDVRVSSMYGGVCGHTHVTLYIHVGVVIWPGRHVCAHA